jgi:hypothetical protein
VPETASIARGDVVVDARRGVRGRPQIDRAATQVFSTTPASAQNRTELANFALSNVSLYKVRNEKKDEKRFLLHFLPPGPSSSLLFPNTLTTSESEVVREHGVL